MFWRYGPTVLFAAGMIGLAVSAYGYFFTQDGPGVVIDEPDRDFPAMKIGENAIRFRLHNPTRHNVRVVGYGEC